MTSSVDTPAGTPDPRPEAERQLAAAVERHREVLASMQETGRPETGQHVAVKAVGRAVHLVSFSLRHATGCGVPFDRLVELTGWEPELVSEAVSRAPDPLRPPAPRFVARLVPPDLDPGAVAQAAASAEATTNLQALMQAILADVDAWSREPADLVALHDRLDGEWRTWRQARGLR
ncbi:MAG: hypothetical protein ABWZ67_05455 [Solirubrobacteraceae bacterium]